MYFIIMSFKSLDTCGLMGASDCIAVHDSECLQKYACLHDPKEMFPISQFMHALK